MDLYEDAVESYLTICERCAVIPQVPILKDQEGQPWEAYPDFLALNFGQQQAWIVEVTKSRNWGSVKNLIQKRAIERPDIEAYIKRFTLNGQISDFGIEWRFFVRAEHKTKAEGIAVEANFRAGSITTLESVFHWLVETMP
jgi:hypothetical protein